MHKKVLVCLPLNDAHRAALEASVPEFEFRFNALDDVHAEDVLWADIVLGNAPVSMIRQNKHIEWFQSNSAGPDAYLKPGVLPENCMVTNATGAYGLAISEWMLAMWLGIQKDMFLYRDRQNQRQWAPIDRPVRGITGARVLCVGMGARVGGRGGGRPPHGPPRHALPGLLPACGGPEPAGRGAA